MKYPQEQFNTLVNTLTVFSKYFDIQSMHPCQLHFLVYQQHSEGQKHNRLCFDAATRTIKRHGNMEPEKAFPIITEPNSCFLLYPEGCNDSHIETATKRAMKQIKL